MGHFIDILQSYPWIWFTGLHLTVGRSVSVLYAISQDLNPWAYGPIAFAWDIVQIPMWWRLYNATSRHTFKWQFFGNWIEHREEKAEHRRIWQTFGALGDSGIVLLSALPFWGCGMWTATLLAWTLGMRLHRAFWFLALGGLLGLILIMGFGSLIKSLIT